jgi:hypothetical protein
MTQPQGFEVPGPDGEKWVCRLKKGLYGLKQSGRLWYYKLATELEHLGFSQIKSDPSIYIWEKDGTTITISVFVNDITIVSQSQEKIKWLKEHQEKGIYPLLNLASFKLTCGILADFRDISFDQKTFVIL